MNVDAVYVNLLQAEWLKDKGFDELCEMLFIDDKLISANHYLKVFIKVSNKDLSKDVTAPEQHQVVEWLLQKHNIWVEITMGKDHTGVWFDYDIFSTIKPRKDDEIGEDGIEYEEDLNEKFLNYKTTYDSMIDSMFESFDKSNHSSPQAAYSAAFDYIKEKNLI
jgi:hypothetical protein